MISKLLTFSRGFLVLIILLNAGSLASQPDNPPPPDDVPITGVEILLGAGALLGAKKYFDKKKNN